MTLYRVAKKPDGLLGLLVFSVLGRAADGVLLNGFWYHYRRGVFCKTPERLLWRKGGYIVSAVGKSLPSDVEYLERSIGKKCGIRNNCITTVTLWLTTRNADETLGNGN